MAIAVRWRSKNVHGDSGTNKKNHQEEELALNHEYMHAYFGLSFFLYVSMCGCIKMHSGRNALNSKAAKEIFCIQFKKRQQQLA